MPHPTLSRGETDAQTELESASGTQANSFVRACPADGFFDAGMLLQALKGSKEEKSKASEHARRRNVGKRLRLSEY